jgi:hypothetical protein
MANASLEERVATLEAQVAQLLRANKPRREKDWRRTIGMFTGDEIMWQIDQNALAYREEDRRRAREEYDRQEQDDNQ